MENGIIKVPWAVRWGMTKKTLEGKKGGRTGDQSNEEGLPVRFKTYQLLEPPRSWNNRPTPSEPSPWQDAKRGRKTMRCTASHGPRGSRTAQLQPSCTQQWLGGKGEQGGGRPCTKQKPRQKKQEEKPTGQYHGWALGKDKFDKWYWNFPAKGYDGDTCVDPRLSKIELLHNPYDLCSFWATQVAPPWERGTLSWPSDTRSLAWRMLHKIFCY